MVGAAESIQIGTCMPALLMRASMHAETLASSAALGAPLSQPGARPIAPANLWFLPVWSALVRVCPEPSAHEAM